MPGRRSGRVEDAPAGLPRLQDFARLESGARCDQIQQRPGPGDAGGAGQRLHRPGVKTLARQFEAVRKGSGSLDRRPEPLAAVDPSERLAGPLRQIRIPAGEQQQEARERLLAPLLHQPIQAGPLDGVTPVGLPEEPEDVGQKPGGGHAVDRIHRLGEQVRIEPQFGEPVQDELPRRLVPETRHG